MQARVRRTKRVKTLPTSLMKGLVGATISSRPCARAQWVIAKSDPSDGIVQPGIGDWYSRSPRSSTATSSRQACSARYPSRAGWRTQPALSEGRRRTGALRGECHRTPRGVRFPRSQVSINVSSQWGAHLIRQCGQLEWRYEIAERDGARTRLPLVCELTAGSGRARNAPLGGYQALVEYRSAGEWVGRIRPVVHLQPPLPSDLRVAIVRLAPSACCK